MSFQDIKLIDVGILVFDGVDFLDFVGPLEVFNAAQIVDPSVGDPDSLENMYQSIPLFNTKLVSIYNQEFIKTGDGSKVIPDYKLEEIKEEKINFKPFVWVIPGGKGIHEVRKDAEFIQWLTNAVKSAHLSLSVCTGAYALAQTGIYDDETTTTHWRHYNIFQHEFPHLNLANNVRYVESHNLITSGGISCGIDGALKIIQRLVSNEVAQRVADRIVYPWLE